jgi:hypothetical protein
MAILKSVVDVNNGNTGWTKADVMDALETVFANLGWHGGSTVTGVPARAQSPAGAIGDHESWRQSGGPAISSITYKNRYYDVINQNDTSYRVLEKYFFNSAYDVTSSFDTIVINQHGLQTGDQIHWAPGGTIESQNINGLTLDTIYYVIRLNDNSFQLAANATDAANGTYIDLLDGGALGAGYAAKSGTLYGFRDVNTSDFDNAEITCNNGDILYFNVEDTTSGGGFFICRNTDSYSSNTEVTTDNWGGYISRTSATGMGTGSVTWDTVDWFQTNTVPYETNHVSQDPEKNGVVSYIYTNSVIPSMKAVINVRGVYSNRGSVYPFWMYTIPANGSRSELKVQVYRYAANAGTSYRGKISSVYINSIGSGWSNDETITIPGTAIGGISPDNDLVFGVQTAGSSTNGDGIATIQVTNLGAGSNFYQKHPQGSFAILKNVNDNSKTYGTTYWSFSTDANNDYRMYINSGSGWEWRNVYGEGYLGTNIDGGTNYGYFTGQDGRDRQQNYAYAARSDSSFTNFNYASTATPTAYPLSIRTYRAQAPQDQNFAVIQFTQTINGAIIPYGTFTIHKGATFGSNVWNLDHVYLGTYTQFDVGNRDIYTYYRSPGDYTWSSVYPQREPWNSQTKTREASYGYLRDENGDLHRTRYTCNIDTEVDNNNYQHISMYYRNSTYDGITSAADYYKPIKGLPIDNSLVPCPYYMPDDFAMLQVSTTPGLTQFRPGDTITISPSEVYEVVLAGYQTQQNGLDNINNNSTIGMIFMARTV